MLPAATADQLARWVSPLRLEPFVEIAEGDRDLAARLYEWNEQLAAAMFEVIASVEVIVRNAVHQQMKSTTPANSLNSWLTDAHVLQPGQLESVQAVVARLRNINKEPSEDRVVAGLYLSFWAFMVGKNYEDLWRHRLHPAFPHATARNDVAPPLNRLVHVRNRAAHHHSLLTWDVPAALTDTFTLLGYVDDEAESWVRGRERVTALLSQRPTR